MLGYLVERQLNKCFACFYMTNSLSQMSQVNRNTCHPHRFSSWYGSSRRKRHTFSYKPGQFRTLTVHKSYFLWPVAWPLACMLPHMGLCWTHTPKHVYTHTTRTRLCLLDNTCSPHEQLLCIHLCLSSPTVTGLGFSSDRRLKWNTKKLWPLTLPE